MTSEPRLEDLIRELKERIVEKPGVMLVLWSDFFRAFLSDGVAMTGERNQAMGARKRVETRAWLAELLPVTTNEELLAISDAARDWMLELMRSVKVSRN
jgi:hypothetical protein